MQFNGLWPSLFVLSFVGEVEQGVEGIPQIQFSLLVDFGQQTVHFVGILGLGRGNVGFRQIGLVGLQQFQIGPNLVR